MYLRDSDYNPIGCLVFSQNKYRTKVRYQISVVHPTDNKGHFDRTFARQLALGRLIDDRIVLEGFSGNESILDITEAIMRDIIFDKEHPSRARKAAAIWLKKLDKNRKK
jgi:hypothetical protein